MIAAFTYGIGIVTMYIMIGVIERAVEIDKYGEPAPFWMRTSVAILWPLSMIGLAGIFVWHVIQERAHD